MVMLWPKLQFRYFKRLNKPNLHSNEQDDMLFCAHLRLAFIQLLGQEHNKEASHFIKQSSTYNINEHDYSTVIMDSSRYRNKMGDILGDATYGIIKKDPTTQIKRKLILLLKQSLLPSVDSKMLQPHSLRPPGLYGLPKIHKSNVYLRPIVSTIGSPTYSLAKYLKRLISPLVGKCRHHVKKISSICGF